MGRAHGELLLVVHHLLLLVLVLLRVLRLLVLGWTRLHVCVLWRWGGIKGRAALGVGEAIVGRIHDWRGGSNQEPSESRTRRTRACATARAGEASEARRWDVTTDLS